MSDDFLAGLRERPRPAFEEELKQRLDAIDEGQASRGRAVERRWLRPALAAGLALAALVVALSVPSVRASAVSLLEVFRVQRFAAVKVDPSRFEELHRQGLDPETLMGGRVQTLQDPGAPVAVSDVAAATSRVGFAVAQPSTLPKGSSLAGVEVRGRGSVEVTLDMDRLAEVANALGATDIDIPYELNGSLVRIQTPPVAMLRYTRGSDEFRLLQGQRPEVGLPDGIDLPRLGAIGLRLAGMSEEEARAFAARIDWHTTLLVPVPASGGSFRDVAVGDGQGLLVTVRPPRKSRTEAAPASSSNERQSVLLWSKGDRVFALQGPGTGVELVEMANTIG